MKSSESQIYEMKSSESQIYEMKSSESQIYEMKSSESQRYEMPANGLFCTLVCMHLHKTISANNENCYNTLKRESRELFLFSSSSSSSSSS
jgi:hypothetical protein